MAYSYTRQSTISDGDTITAALFNNEYNQLLNAFAYSSSDASATGHRHDGSAAQGGNIGKIGDLDFLNKVEVDSSNNRWGFYVEVSSSAVEQVRIQDGAIVPVTDNDIDLGTSSLEFKDVYIDGTAYLDAINFNGTAITSTAAELNILDGVTSTAAELNILDGVTSTAAELNILDGVTSTTAELNILDGVTSTTAELNILDGVTATTAELNIMDGDTSATSTTLADADRVVVNDNGTMKQVALTDFETYFESALDTGTNITTVGALNAGSITSGFGAIDIGSSNLTATGTISLGATSFNDNNITNVGSIQLDSIAGDADTNTSITFSGSDVITIATGGTTALTIDASQNVAIAGDLTITGDDLTMGTNTAGHILVADGTNFNPTAVGDLSEISTVANDDVLLAVDTSGGGLKKLTRSTLISGLAASGAISNVSEDSSPQLGGDLDVNGNALVSTSNGNIALTPNGSGLVTVGTSLVPASADGAALGSASAEFSDLYLADAGVVFFGNDQEVKLIHSADKGLILKHTATADDKPVSLTLQTGETDIAANDVLGKIDFQAPDEGTGTDAILVAAGIEAVSEGDFSASANATKLSFKTAASEAAAEKMSLSSGGNLTVSGNVIAVDLDISGDVDIDGTLEADAITVNGTTLAETISDTVGAMVGSNTETGISVTYDDSDNTLDFVLGSAQTTITSLLATDIKIGEDDQTKIDFETADEIHFYAANVEQVYVADNIFGPQSDSDVDLGSTSVRWKDAYVDSITVTGEIDGDSLDIEGDADINGTTNLDAVDIDGAVQVDATVTVGVDDTGYDVKFFGATSGKYMEWDESADQLEVVGTATVDGTLQLKNGSTSAGKIEFFEDSDNGTNKVTLIGPASTSDITLTLPSSDGDSGQAMITDGSGNLSFTTISGAYTAWAVKTGNFTASAGDQLIVNSSSATTITLPASASAGDTVVVKATGGGTVTLGRNSQNINSTAADGTLLSGSSVQLVFVDSTIGFLEL